MHTKAEFVYKMIERKWEIAIISVFLWVNCRQKRGKFPIISILSMLYEKCLKSVKCGSRHLFYFFFLSFVLHSLMALRKKHFISSLMFKQKLFVSIILMLAYVWFTEQILFTSRQFSLSMYVFFFQLLLFIILFRFEIDSESAHSYTQ